MVCISLNHRLRGVTEVCADIIIYIAVQIVAFIQIIIRGMCCI